MPTTSNKYITGEQLKKAVHSRIDKMYESRKQIISEEDMKSSYTPEEFKAAMREETKKIFNK